jgi:hypothetical protein
MNDSPGKPVPVSGDRLRVIAGNLIANLRELIQSIEHLPTISLGSIENPEPEFIESVYRAKLGDVRRSVWFVADSYAKFREGFKPLQRQTAKLVVEYAILRPVNYLSNLERLLSDSSRFLEHIGWIWFLNTPRDDGDFKQHESQSEWKLAVKKFKESSTEAAADFVRRERHLDPDWWDSREIPKGSSLNHIVYHLPHVCKNHGDTLAAITEREFLGHLTQECKILGLENHTQNPQNPPGNESPKPEIDTQNPQIKDGLYRDQRRFVWCGESYDELSDTIMNILEMLLKNYPNKTFEGEIENKIGAIPISGFWRWFRVTRGGKQVVHPVRKIVCGRIDMGIGLMPKP